jgi:streptomycin 6-kinase
MIDLGACIPSRMVENVRMYFGAGGEEWLIGLPALLSRTEQQWRISIQKPFSNLSINLVAPAVLKDGSEAVLKSGVPCREIATEIEALVHFAENGAARVLKSDAEAGLILLEKITPGTALSEMASPNNSVDAAAAVMRSLWKSPSEGHSFPNLRDWFSGLEDVRRAYDGSSGPLPCRLFETAEQLAAELLDSSEDEVVLHGDCHHENILMSENRGWLAIDPKGVIGDRVFEVCPFLRNPQAKLHERGFLDSIASRSARFCEILSLDASRLHSWGLAEAVLSASWDINCPAQSWKRTVEVAEKYADILGIGV